MKSDDLIFSVSGCCDEHSMALVPTPTGRLDIYKQGNNFRVVAKTAAGRLDSGSSLVPGGLVVVSREGLDELIAAL